ncbi:MAG: NADH-quinone oxidoreductase subunit J [Alcaligenaceae bacterium]|nr:NADH-quinone oxidoreductase subunit J [Alcaligenaceae bacterium]
MTFTTVLFYILATILVVAGARVITSRSPVTAVLHLILSFVTASLLWILIGAEFLGLLLIVVYVGAVMVMFLFVVMMIDVVPESLRAGFRTYLPLGLVVGGIMVLEIAFVLGTVYYGSGAPVALPDSYNNTMELGVAMYSQYSFPIQVGGLVLLVGMISAIALTLRERRNRKYVSASAQLHVKASERVRLVSMKSETEVASPAKEGDSE